MIKRLWPDQRNACLLTLALLVIGVVVSPWFLLAAVLPLGGVLFTIKGSKKEQPLKTIESSQDIESIEPLTGSALIDKIKEIGDGSKSDLIRSCGYVSKKENGGERLNFTAFYEALLIAKGVSLKEFQIEEEESSKNESSKGDKIDT